MMKGEHFKKLAESSHASYEQDEWIFIRELVQNSRDSGADKIAIRAYTDDKGFETIVVHDNGTGMTRIDVEKFLFRLYSSSKEKDIERIGMFGVGFWTVLKFNPEKIIIESLKGSDSINIVLDSQLNVMSSNTVSIKTGTGIALKRKAVFRSKDQFITHAENAVLKYCRYATGTKNHKLTVMFNGQPITEPLALAEGSFISFRKGDLRGVVGFSETPEVILMKGGIPLWKGRFLEELKKDFSGTVSSFSGPGLAPVFLIDGNGFESVISRKDVRQSAYLKNAVKTAEKALSQLIQDYTKRAFPDKKGKSLSWRVSLPYFFKKMLSNGFFQKGVFALSGILLISVICSYLFANIFYKTFFTPYASPVMQSDSEYMGPVPDLQSNPVKGITYSPPDSIRFGLFRADVYDISRGFIQNKKSKEIEKFYQSEGDKQFSVTIEISRPGNFYLPVPEHGIVLKDTFLLNNQPVGLNISEQSGGVAAVIKHAGKLKYICIIPSDEESPDEEDLKRFTELPKELVLPIDLSRDILSIVRGETKNRVIQSMHLTYKYCKPMQSQDSALRFLNTEGSWLEKVIEAGEGDCDVINGFLVIVMRHLGIPARLVIGYVGENGTVNRGFHAWVEFYRNGWMSADLSELSITEEFKPYFNRYNKDSQSAPSVIQKNMTGELSKLERVWSILKAYRIFVFIILSLLLIILFIKHIHLFKKNMVGQSQPEELKLSLSKMMVRAVLQRSAWENHREIFTQRVIPGVGGQLYSLNDIEVLTKEHQCFSGKSYSIYSMAISEIGCPVLDIEDRYFSKLISLLNGVTDLTKLETILEHSISTEENDFFSKLNTLFNTLDRFPITLLFSNNLGKVNLLDFRLPKIKKTEIITGNIITVNIDSGEFRKLCNLYIKEPVLSLFKGVEFIIRESVFFRQEKSRYLRELAETILSGDIHE